MDPRDQNHNQDMKFLNRQDYEDTKRQVINLIDMYADPDDKDAQQISLEVFHDCYNQEQLDAELSKWIKRSKGR